MTDLTRPAADMNGPESTGAGTAGPGHTGPDTAGPGTGPGTAVGALPADRLARMLGTLANPHRLGVVAALARRRNYVSRLARELGISRALLQAHLRRLEAAGLVTGQLEMSSDGKAMKFYEVTPFALHLTPQSIADALSPLTTHEHVPEDGEKGSPQ
ncbi:ArsR/SmtB family transcription factor [Streptomyces sp. NRRL S-1022]|uniref:ArsR/SmtB family transcription factor n=1 Tax=Streptomyces sp. NRRL S-1022 TaxID=1463880 RepID=UPI003B63DAD9